MSDRLANSFLQIQFCTPSLHILPIHSTYVLKGAYCAHFIAIGLTKWCSASYIYCFLSLYSILPSIYRICVFISTTFKGGLSAYTVSSTNRKSKNLRTTFFLDLRKFRKCGFAICRPYNFCYLRTKLFFADSKLPQIRKYCTSFFSLQRSLKTGISQSKTCLYTVVKK
jgi:hypothetical protein